MWLWLKVTHKAALASLVFKRSRFTVTTLFHSPWTKKNILLESLHNRMHHVTRVRLRLAAPNEKDQSMELTPSAGLLGAACF